MRTHRIAGASIALAFGLLGITLGVAQAQNSPADPPGDEPRPHETAEAKEQATTLEKVPTPVRKTINDQAKGGTIQKVQEVLKGKNITYYEADVKMPDGTMVHLEVNPDGTVMHPK